MKTTGKAQKNILPNDWSANSSLKGHKAEDRYNIAKELQLSQEPSAELLLFQMVDDVAWNVRVQAVESLQNFRSLLARIAARAAANDSEMLVRLAAAETIGVIGNRRDIPWLARLIHDKNWEVRSSAATSLGCINGPKAQKLLVDALFNDLNPVVRRDAVYALSHFKQDVFPILINALDKENEKAVCIALNFALYKMGQSQSILTYLGFLTDQNALVRSNAINGIEVNAVSQQDVQLITQALLRIIDQETEVGIKADAQQKMLDILEVWH